MEESAWGYEERYKQKQDIVVGVNKYVTDDVDEVEILRVDPESERQQVERLKAFKADRDQARGATRGSRSCARPAAASENLLDPIRAALKDRATHRRGLRRDARRVRRVLRGLSAARPARLGAARRKAIWPLNRSLIALRDRGSRRASAP